MKKEEKERGIQLLSVVKERNL